MMQVGAFWDGSNGFLPIIEVDFSNLIKCDVDSVLVLQFALSSQLLSQRSKTRTCTSVADPESASSGTFQCMQFLPFLFFFACSI